MSETRPLRVADLPQNQPTRFDITPSAATRAAIATEIGVDAVKKLTFQGELRSEGKSDWRLKGRLGATVVQLCVVTLDPVTSRMDVDVVRLYVADYATPEGDEAEMPEDNMIDPLETHIDPEAVMIEALALNLPEYPRTKGVALGEAVFTEPGKDAMRDEDTRPFAGLAAFRDSMDGGKDGDG